MFRTPSSRQTPDLAAITAIFKANNLGPVPMKPCAPSLKVELACSPSTGRSPASSTATPS
ncbi:hypothetical protein [Streptomyces sp. NPDC058086]|uniref:hypothetical protein n=1 Tax=Streptomyces sp. NPDC058086 TaxID=3346334 RepID=UPI0036E9AA3D